MGSDYRLKFAHPAWYAANVVRVAERVRALPRLKNQPSPEEFRLRDDSIANSWSYDLRVFVRPTGVEIEVSAASATLREDVRDLLAWIRRETAVELVDDDGMPVAIS